MKWLMLVVPGEIEENLKQLIEIITKDLSTLNLTKRMTFQKSQWRQKICVANPNS